MTIIRTFMLALLLLVGVVVTFAQSEQAGKSTTPSATAVTVSISAKGIRFTALGSVGQMRLEVFNTSTSGDPIYSSEFKAGNIQDWALKDNFGQTLLDGSYLCVVTVRDVSGRLGMKQGTVLVQGGQASLKLGESEQAGAVQSEKALTPVTEGSATAVTVLAHDGQQGRVVSGRGGLSFGIGDFFAGKDVEHMRLTATGNLGIGVENPQAKLDVAGLIRTGEGIVFPDGSVQTTAYAASVRSLGERGWLQRDAQGRTIAEEARLGKAAGPEKGLRFTPNISGSGTTGRITKWLDGIGTVGDSVISESSGNVGIGPGTTSPGEKLSVGYGSNTDISIGSVTNNKTYLGSFNNNVVFAINRRVSDGLFANPSLPTASFGFYTSSGDSAIRFNTSSTNGVLDTERMRIDKNGNVGIGTTSPAEKLSVGYGSNTDIAIGSVTNNKTYLGSYNDNVVFAINRRVSDGLFANPSLPTASFGFYTSSGNSAILFNTSNTNGVLDTERMRIDKNGNVGIGTSSPQAKLDVAGDIQVAGNAVISGNIAAKYQDVAEWVPARQHLTAGTVVSLDTTRNNSVVPSARAYDTHIAGVISLQPGLILGEGGEGKVLVATTGRVRVKVDASQYPIKIGDLLVTSNKSGMAMKSRPIRMGGALIHRPGTIIGKALEPLAKGQGEILVLLSMQ